jgi:hypothetical protein
MSKKDQIIVVCARITDPLLLPDNVISTCDACGWAVQHRPHAPKGKRRCLKCAAHLMNNNTVHTTSRMVEDFLAWRRKQQQ